MVIQHWLWAFSVFSIRHTNVHKSVASGNLKRLRASSTGIVAASIWEYVYMAAGTCPPINYFERQQPVYQSHQIQNDIAAVRLC